MQNIFLMDRLHFLLIRFSIKWKIIVNALQAKKAVYRHTSLASLLFWTTQPLTI